MVCAETWIGTHVSAFTICPTRPSYPRPVFTPSFGKHHPTPAMLTGISRPPAVETVIDTPFVGSMTIPKEKAWGLPTACCQMEKEAERPVAGLPVSNWTVPELSGTLRMTSTPLVSRREKRP
jgi:hypothetical protein